MIAKLALAVGLSALLAGCSSSPESTLKSFYRAVRLGTTQANRADGRSAAVLTCARSRTRASGWPSHLDESYALGRVSRSSGRACLIPESVDRAPCRRSSRRSSPLAWA